MAILGNTSERILFCKANNKKKQEVPDETDIQKRKQNPALYDNRNDSHQSAVWNTMEGIAEKCSGMVGQYLSGVLFFRMGSVWLRCRKISIRTEAKDILLACESY